MEIVRTLFIVASATLSLFAATARGQSGPKQFKPYPLENFDEQGHTCRAKGRLQDLTYCSSRLIDRIVADGKDAIPVLISQLRDERPTKEPIYDYWGLTTVGDVAYFILNDLFTDGDWKTFNMPDLQALDDSACKSYAEACWRQFFEETW